MKRMVFIMGFQLAMSFSLIAKVDDASVKNTLNSSQKNNQCELDEPDTKDFVAINHLFEQITQRRFSVRNNSLYLPLIKAVQYYRNNQLLVVDVRRAVEFEQFRIPGSINLPLHQLKYKSQFKKREILIVNDGKSYARVEVSVIELLEQGFKDVKILNGGINYWSQKVKQVDGQVGQASRLKLLSVREFLGELKHGPWLVIDVSAKPSFVEKINGEVVHLLLNELFSLNLNQILKQNNNPLTRVLFVSDDKQVYSQLNRELLEVDLDVYQLLSQTTDYIPVYKKQRLMAYRRSNREINGCGFGS